MRGKSSEHWRAKKRQRALAYTRYCRRLYKESVRARKVDGGDQRDGKPEAPCGVGSSTDFAKQMVVRETTLAKIVRHVSRAFCCWSRKRTCLRELKARREKTRSMITSRQVRLDLMGMASGQASERPEWRTTRTFLGWRDPGSVLPGEPTSEWEVVREPIPRWQAVEDAHQLALRELHAVDHSQSRTDNIKFVGATPASQTEGVSYVGLAHPPLYFGWCKKHSDWHECEWATEDKDQWPEKPRYFDLWKARYEKDVLLRKKLAEGPMQGRMQESPTVGLPTEVAVQETTRGPAMERQPEQRAQPIPRRPVVAPVSQGSMSSVC